MICTNGFCFSDLDYPAWSMKFRLLGLVVFIAFRFRPPGWEYDVHALGFGVQFLLGSGSWI